MQSEPISQLFDKVPAQELPFKTRHVPDKQVVPETQNGELALVQENPAGIVQIFRIQLEPVSQLDDNEPAHEPPISSRQAPDKQVVPT